MRFSKKNRAVQLMALACIAAILVPGILAGLLISWFWFLMLLALIFVPVLFVERRRARS